MVVHSSKKGVLTGSSTSVTSNKSYGSADRSAKQHSRHNNDDGASQYSSYDLPSIDHRDDHDRENDENPASHRHFSQYAKIDKAIIHMKSSLDRFTRANDRRMVLRKLKDVKYLKALPIDPRSPPVVDLEELEMEVAKESLVLNGQAFHRKTKYGRTSTDFLHVLHELCYQICDNASIEKKNAGASGGGGLASSNVSMGSTLIAAMSPDTLYYDLLCRLARTITSADCFAKLNDILGSPDLILMNSSAERKPKSKKNSKGVTVTTVGSKDEMSTIPPMEINIFEEGGNIHAHIITTLGYGLYRKLDVNTGRPWIKLQAELNERMNFSTNAQVRHVNVILPDMYV